MLAPSPEPSYGKSVTDEGTPGSEVFASQEAFASQQAFPRSFGKYELLEPIGAGGMAEIYLARLTGVAGFAKTVVVKRMSPALRQRADALAMFVEEAKLMASVHHKNVVQVFELSDVDGEFFMAMEYVEGLDLRQLLVSCSDAKQRLPPAITMRILCEVLDGLDYVHGLSDEGRFRKVIHRDVTPSNIFISRLAEVKLGDFGVAKVEGSEIKTSMGQLKGKISYMCPEQILGEPMDQRADIFSAGVVLWECLTQRRLFGGNTEFQAMRAICQPARPAPSRYAADIDPTLDAIALRALAMEPDDRFQSASEMQWALLDALESTTPSFRLADMRRFLERWVKSPAPTTTTTPASEAHLDLPKHTDEHTKTTPDPETHLDLAFLDQADAEESEDDGPVAARTGHERQREQEQPRKHRRDAPPRDGLIPRPRLRTPQPRARRTFAAEDLAEGVGSSFPNRWATYANTEEPYEGPFPFWVTDGQHTIGPIDLPALEQIVRDEVRIGPATTVRLSADGQRWATIREFAGWSGQDVLLGDADGNSDGLLAASRRFSGNIEDRSLISLFAELHDAGLTGRVVFRSDTSHRHARTEIHLAAGKPMRITSNQTALQAPEILVQRKLLSRDDVTEVVHGVLRVRQPIASVVRDRVRSDVSRLELMFFKDRLFDLFGWRFGRFAFFPDNASTSTSVSAGANGRSGPTGDPTGVPMSRSLLQLLPEMVFRTWSIDELKLDLRDHLKVKLRGTERLLSLAEDLALSSHQRTLVDRLKAGRKIASLLTKREPEDRAALVLALILLRTGGLEPRPR